MSFAEMTLKIIKFLWKIICLCATKIYEGILFIFFIIKTFASTSWERFDTSRDEQQRLLERNQERQRLERVNKLRNEFAQLKSENARLQQENSVYTKWHQPDQEHLNELTRMRAQFSEEHVAKMFRFYDKIVIALIETVLLNLLTGQEKTAARSSKDEYRYYGLLLSGCNNKITKEIKEEKVFGQISQKYTFVQGNKAKIKASILNPSVDLVHSMLTLIPPLLIIQPQWQDDNVQDTNRLTWDETSDQPLMYYRPVLVYGNQLHVAVKGLVGNNEPKIHQD